MPVSFCLVPPTNGHPLYHLGMNFISAAKRDLTHVFNFFLKISFYSLFYNSEISFTERFLCTENRIVTVALEVASKHCTLVGFAHYTSAGFVVIH